MSHFECVIKSGIFQVETKNDTDIPIGVYVLTPGKRTLSKKKTIPQVNIRYFVFDLEKCLSWYNNPPRDISEEILKDTLKDIENDLNEVLIKKYQFRKVEASKYVKEIFRKKGFSKLVWEKISNTGVFKEKKGALRYRKILRLYHTFQKYLRVKENSTDWYIAHFLVGCGIEEGTPRAAYNRIRTFRKRYESKNPAFKTFRKNPQEVITIP